MAQDKDGSDRSSGPAQFPQPGPGRGLPGMGGSGRGMGPARFGVPVDKPKHLGSTLLRLWQYFGSERRLLLVIFALVLVGGGLGLAGPYLIGRAVDQIDAGRHAVDFGALGITVALLAGAYLGNGITGFGQGWLIAGVSQRIIARLRETLFAKLQKLPISFFDLRTHGDLMSRLSNDIDNISSTISQFTTQLMANAIAILGSLVMMMILSPWLTLAGLITMPLVYWVTRNVTRRTRGLFKEQQEALGRLNGHIEESISGINVVKAFNHEDQVIAEFDRVNDSLCVTGTKALIWSGFIMPLMNVINNLSFAVIAATGGFLAIRGRVTVGVIASFLSYSRQFTRPINELANVYNMLQSAVAGAERVFEILDEPGEAEDPGAAVVLQECRGHVVFEDVTFGYRPGLPILKNVSFEAKPGSATALVGPTGAGKTTIVNLLARFYEIESGRILIDGRDIREYTRDSLRRCFGIVLQDTYLFSGTIRENIRYGRLDAGDAEVERAAVMANADRFIKRLPKGYDTVLSESGTNLSQGQRQLLAIARAILADASILILDEATSSVDTRTELHIQEAMIQLMKDRTSFIIAHRLSTIRDADTIMVIDHGAIVEKGNHCELMRETGFYHHLYVSQLKQRVEG
jgi:ATP-binding cassette subfamily B multidrug efflux pump